MTENLENFACKRCGECCKWTGFVRVSEAEVDAIAAFLELTVPEFTAKYAKLAPDRRSLNLLEHDDGSCIFLSDRGDACLINPVKPEQCRKFPRIWNFPGWDRICAGGKEGCRGKFPGTGGNALNFGSPG